MNFHKNHWLLFGVTCFGFIGLSLIVGILPAIWVQNNSEPLPGMEPMTAIVKQGLGVYVSEGCVACHTQQVRPLEMDLPWGRPAAPGDYAYVTPLGPWAPYAPAVLGSERTGPDLTNVGARQASDVWQYLHLYNPRSVVPDSVMPAYPWLFERVKNVPEGKTAVPVPAGFAPADGSQVVPTEKGEALVAYLLSLKQPSLSAPAATAPEAEAPVEQAAPQPPAPAAPAEVPSPAAAPAEAPAPAATPAAAEAPAPAPATPEAPTPAPAAAEASAPTAAEAPAPPEAPAAETVVWDEALGAATFTSYCSACHQANGEGLPGVFPPLVGDPVVTAADPTEHIETVLHGRQGSTIGGVAYASPMPPFEAQLTDEQVAALINHERTSWGNSAPLVTPEDVAAVRGGSR